jgi:hypothetical protein
MHNRLVEAHARLSTLKMDLPEAHAVEEKHVREFHDILQVLEHASGCDLGSYRVPAADLARHNGGGGGAGEVHGHGENGNGHGAAPCDRDSLMTRIDGVLTFFGVKATLPRLNS